MGNVVVGERVDAVGARGSKKSRRQRRRDRLKLPPRTPCVTSRPGDHVNADVDHRPLPIDAYPGHASVPAASNQRESGGLGGSRGCIQGRAAASRPPPTSPRQRQCGSQPALGALPSVGTSDAEFGIDDNFRLICAGKRLQGLRSREHARACGRGGS